MHIYFKEVCVGRTGFLLKRVEYFPKGFSVIWNRTECCHYHLLGTFYKNINSQFLEPEYHSSTGVYSKMPRDTKGRKTR